MALVLRRNKKLGRYRYTAQQHNPERTLRRPVWGLLLPRLGMKNFLLFLFVLASFSVVSRIWFLSVAQFKDNTPPLSVTLSGPFIVKSSTTNGNHVRQQPEHHHQHHDDTSDGQKLLPLTWEGDGTWINYTCKMKKSPNTKKRPNIQSNQTGIVIHWNKTAAAANGNKYNTTTNASIFLSYSYEDTPKIMTRIDTSTNNDGSNNDSNNKGNCLFDSFLTQQYCQERAMSTVCVYPDVILKIVHSRIAWLTERYMFSVLNDTKYFPKLIYHTGGAAIQRSDILDDYSKPGGGYTDIDSYDRTIYDNNDGSIRIDKHRKECWTMIIENVCPKGTCQNSFNNTKASRRYYTKELTSVFDKYFAPHHIVPEDLNVRNVIIHSDQLHIIDFGLYQIIDDVEELTKRNSQWLLLLSNLVRRNLEFFTGM